MDKQLADVLIKIGDEFSDQISMDSRFYLEVNFGKQAEKYGHFELTGKYHDINAIVPLRRPVRGMKVRVDGRTFVNYVQFDSGIVVPHYIARQVDLPHRTYTAKDSMICNFA